MIAKTFAPEKGIKPFVIMKRLARCHAGKSHPPPLAHSPRIPGAFVAGHVIVWIYPSQHGGEFTRQPVLLNQWRMMRAVAAEIMQIIFWRLLTVRPDCRSFVIMEMPQEDAAERTRLHHRTHRIPDLSGPQPRAAMADTTRSQKRPVSRSTATWAFGWRPVTWCRSATVAPRV